MCYSKSKIYCIRNHINDDIYIGSTTTTLSNRMSKHRYDCKNQCGTIKLYQMMNEIGIDNFYIELLEEYPCNNLEQLRKREGETIRQHGTINMQIAGRSKKEYVDEHKEEKKEYDRVYREQNRETRNAQKREYYNQNKDKPEFKQKRKEYCEKTKEHKKEYDKLRYEEKKNLHDRIMSNT